MALEELSTTVSKLTFNIFGSESEKKVSNILLLYCCCAPVFVKDVSSKHIHLTSNYSCNCNKKRLAVCHYFTLSSTAAADFTTIGIAQQQTAV